jgi:hypothetical protein
MYEQVITVQKAQYFLFCVNIIESLQYSSHHETLWCADDKTNALFTWQWRRACMNLFL